MVKQTKDKTMNIRMTKEDYKYLQIAAFTAGITPSKLIRMFADASINAVKIKIQQGAIKLEDFKTVLDD